MLKRIRVLNFRNQTDKTYEFSQGLNLLVGPNGAGKSSIFEAIGIVLFDSPKTSLKDAIQRGKDYATIYLDFNDCKVRRSFGSLIEYVLETPEGTYEGKDTVVAKLSELLGVPDLKSFWHDVLTVKQFGKLRPFDATPNERLLLFGRILGIQRYEDEFKFLKDVLVIGKKEVDALTDKLETLANQNLKAHEENAAIREDKATLPALNKMLAEAVTELSEQQTQIALVERIAENEATLRQLTAYLNQLLEKQRIPAGSRKLYEQQKQAYRVDQNRVQMEMGEYIYTKNTLEQRLLALRETDGACPVCGSDLDKDQRDVLVARTEQEIAALKRPVFEVMEPNLPRRWDDDGLEQEIAAVKMEIACIPAQRVVQVSDVTKVAQRVAELEHRIKRIEERELIEEVDLTGLTTQLAVCKEAYDSLELYRKEVKTRISTIPVVARDAISRKADALYQKFMEGHHSVGLTLDSSYGIEATIRGAIVPFGSLGGAESVTAALAVRLAIRHYLAERIDLLLVDEATDALDKQAQEQMVRIIEELDGQVIVITHENIFMKGNVIEL